MPRARRRRMQRQRRKHGVPIRLVTPSVGFSAFDRLIEEADREMTRALLLAQMTPPSPLSRVDLLALAASAKTRQERTRYRRMAEVAVR